MRAKTNQLRLCAAVFFATRAEEARPRGLFLRSEQGFKGPSTLNSFTAESNLQGNYEQKPWCNVNLDFRKLAEVFFHPNSFAAARPPRMVTGRLRKLTPIPPPPRPALGTSRDTTY
jgi:hypothetical protein